MLRECPLKRMVAAESFDRRHIDRFGVRERHEAGAHGLAIEEDRAGAALSLAASFLGPRQLAVKAQRVEKTRHWRRVHLDVAAVHAEMHAASWMRSGVAGICLMSSPRWRIAFTMAGAGPSIGISPTPLAPKGP